jgi:hypothetical protein
MNLIREQDEGNGVGFVAEDAIFEAMIRIRRTVIPIWITATSFFAAALTVLVTILRPTVLSSSYLFSLVIAVAALSICVYQAIGSVRGEAI